MGHFEEHFMLELTYSNVFEYSNDKVDEWAKFEFLETAHPLHSLGEIRSLRWFCLARQKSVRVCTQTIRLYFFHFHLCCSGPLGATRVRARKGVWLPVAEKPWNPSLAVCLRNELGIALVASFSSFYVLFPLFWFVVSKLFLLVCSTIWDAANFSEMPL